MIKKRDKSKRILLAFVVPLFISCLVYFGMFEWAVRPYFFPPQGLQSGEPGDDTYYDLVRNCYPIRLINPEWLNDVENWPDVECRARRILIAGIVFVVIFWMGFKLRRNETA